VYPVKRHRSSLGGFARDSRETAKRAGKTHVWQCSLFRLFRIFTIFASCRTHGLERAPFKRRFGFSGLVTDDRRAR
jgi:hypothetical protein